MEYSAQLAKNVLVVPRGYESMPQKDLIECDEYHMMRKMSRRNRRAPEIPSGEHIDELMSYAAEAARKVVKKE